MINAELQRLTVMVTRPKPQGEQLCELIQQAGGKAVFFPTIDIVALTNSTEFIRQITQLDVYDWLIFISPQAVYHSAPLIKKYWPKFPAKVKVAALGGGTALALQAAALPIHVYPQTQWESEGLLALPEFQQVAGQRVALLQGEGGRELLTTELQRCGAAVEHVIAYRRCLPNIAIESYLSLLTAGKIDIIVSTSSEILQNLDALLGKQAGSSLYTVPLIVVSERMVVLAQTIGFQTILLAKNASHDAIMATLKDHLCQMKLKKH
jgi:uroporphyrinogen-III synthase